MDKNELWNTFMKTGRISDYLRYKKAADKHSEELLSSREEAAEEFYLNNPEPEEPYYDDFDGWYNN